MCRKFKVLYGALLVFTILGENTVQAKSTLPKAEYITNVALKQWKNDGKPFTYIDVREKYEFDIGHLDGAINIPYNKVEEYAEGLDKQAAYVLYCTFSSWRAPYAANYLKDLGFENIYIQKGGVQRWYDQGQRIYASNTNQAGKVADYPKDLIKDLRHPQDKEYPKPIHLTVEELKKYDGQDGQPAYVAVSGKIYDVTQSRLWRGGVHDPSKGKGIAGRDLTEELIYHSPHGVKHLEKFPVVGDLIKDSE